MSLSAKVEYLKGLCDGLELDTDTKEGKILAKIIELLGDMSEEIENLVADVEDVYDEVDLLGEEIDLINEDLEDFEDYIYDESPASCSGCGSDDFSCGCCGNDDDDCFDADFDDEEPVLYEVTCDICGKTITVDEDIIELERIQCPNCGEMIEFELEDDEDEE